MQKASWGSTLLRAAWGSEEEISVSGSCMACGRRSRRARAESHGGERPPHGGRDLLGRRTNRALDRGGGQAAQALHQVAKTSVIADLYKATRRCRSQARRASRQVRSGAWSPAEILDPGAVWHAHRRRHGEDPRAQRRFRSPWSPAVPARTSRPAPRARRRSNTAMPRWHKDELTTLQRLYQPTQSRDAQPQAFREERRLRAYHMGLKKTRCACARWPRRRQAPLRPHCRG